MPVIHAIGLDIVDVGRIAGNIERFGKRFVDRILGSDERRLFERRVDRAVFLAGRFAAKEAVIKALGFRLTDRPAYNLLQIINDATGQPVVHFPPDIAAALGGSRCLVSITHERTHAAAVAIITEDS